MRTKDGLHVYDMCPLAGDLWAIAGPPGWDTRDLCVDDLPEGFRWVSADEWAELVGEGPRYESVLSRLPECWSRWSTGGNCTAYGRSYPNDWYTMLTDESGAYQPVNTDRMLVCTYDEGGEMRASDIVEGVDELMAKLKEHEALIDKGDD